jgi:hypothetical protein
MSSLRAGPLAALDSMGNVSFLKLQPRDSISTWKSIVLVYA